MSFRDRLRRRDSHEWRWGSDMRVLVNGQSRELEVRTTVQTLIDSLPDAPQGRGLAVALNGEVVPRGRWDRTQLGEGARVEIVVAVQGG